MTKIIAEAGVNHNGCMKTAKKLIDAASDAGADIVKFQSFRAEELTSFNAPLASYQEKNQKSFSNQFEMLKHLEISTSDLHDLKIHCDKKNIEFLSTAFDYKSLLNLLELGIDYIKIPSGEITNYHYLNNLKDINKEILLSTGMSDFGEVKNVVDYLVTDLNISAKSITLFQCTSAYPTPLEDCNVSVMKTFKNAFNTKVGLSDHTESLIPSVLAVAMGASFIEKHFTLDKEMHGPDHKASLNIEELHQFITNIRDAELAIGNGKKTIQHSEIDNKKIARRGIYLKRDLKKGDRIKDEDIIFTRPMMDFDPEKYFEILGKESLTDLKKGTGLKVEYFK